MIRSRPTTPGTSAARAGALFVGTVLLVHSAGCSAGTPGFGSSPAGGANNPPSGTAVAPVTTAEDTPSVPITLTGADAEDATALLTVAVVSGPTNGTLDVTTGSAPLSVVYTPAPDFNGSDSFQFTVTDTVGAASAPVTVDLTVTPANDPPTIDPIGTQVATVGTPFSFTPSASDPDTGDVLAFTLIATGLPLPPWATFDPVTGSITGTPALGDVGTVAGLRIQVSDGTAAPVDSNLFSLVVMAGGATQLDYGTAPATPQTAGVVWAAFTVRLEDGGGSLIPASGVDVTLELASGSDALAGTLTRTTFNGIATFDDVRYDVAESITLDVTSPGLTPILGTAIDVVAGAPAQLAFGTPPAAFEQVGTVFSGFSLVVQDAQGNVLVADSSTAVTIGLGSGTGTLGGLLTKTVTAGEAFFNDVTYSRAETITLVGSSGALTPVTSAPIVVQAPLPPGLGVERVSVATPNVQGDLDSFDPSISQDGRFVAFESLATNFDPADTNGLQDVFVRDRANETTVRVSVSSAGAQASAASFDPSISANGNFVAFSSDAANLVMGDTNMARDVFVHDRSTGTTTRVSVATGGGQADGNSNFPSISGDGRFVAFASSATNLVGGDTNGANDVFLHDRLLGTTVRVSLDSGGGEGDGLSSFPSLSFSGDFVAFESDATNLVAGDGNGVRDVFVRDVAAGTTVRASVDSAGTEGDAASGGASVSSDGALVAFSSQATNLVGADTNGARDVFVHDTGLGTTRRVSEDSAGAESNGGSAAPSVSADGRFVAYQTSATNLEPGDTNSFLDVYVKDLLTDESYRVSLSADDLQANGPSRVAAMSGDGRYVAFESDADNLVANDTNGATDVFAVPNESSSGPPAPLEIVRNSRDSAGVEGNSASLAPSASGDGRFVAFESLATNLVAGDANLQIDVFVNDVVKGVTERVSLSSTGVQGIGESRLPSISADGRYIAFESLSENFVAGDTNGFRDVFVRDRVRNRTERVSLLNGGGQLSNHSFNPSISADGRFVAFETLQDGISVADTNGRRDVYVHDRLTGTTELVSQSTGGVAGNFDSFAPSVSPDGTFVAFHSRSTNLVAGDTTANRDVFVRNRAAGTTVRVSVDSAGVEGDDSSFFPSICADGTKVVFESDATNLVAGDTNGVRDVFAHDLATGQTTLVSASAMGALGNGASVSASVSADGSRVAFSSAATNLAGSDLNFTDDVFVKTLSGGAVVRVSVDAADTEANGASRAPAISGDGLRTSFESDASNLVTGDGNATTDVFTTSSD